ncbi:hypothetical protein AB0L63_26990 [Nocardia sp. NPDC051990]|uniref:hypothetical protein n=1 Tax=Nocardia sp. NPDC051990 TaxID=3155285 RepID=UPI00342F8C24
MTGPIRTRELVAPPYLDVTTVTVAQRLVEDGARVHRFDAVAELIDARGTEMEAIADADGFIQYPPTEAIDDHPGLVAWINDAPTATSDTTVAVRTPREGPSPAEVSYLSSTWTNVAPTAVESSDRRARVALLVSAIVDSVDLLAVPRTDGNSGPISVGTDTVITVHDPSVDDGKVTIPNANTLSSTGLIRALAAPTGDLPVNENAVGVELHLLPTTGALYTPPSADVLVTVAVSEPYAAVVAVDDELGHSTIAIRHCATVVFGYRQAMVATDLVAAFSENIATRLRRRHQ